MSKSYFNYTKQNQNKSLILIILFLLLLKSGNAFSQVIFLNNGGSIYNANNQFVINGDVIHQQDGSIKNTGDFYIRGHLTNDNPSGQVFTIGENGWVHLDSAIQGNQIIGGSTLTHFNNLELSGIGIKQLNGIDTEIEDTLSLNGLEFAAGDNIVYILDAGTGVVTNTTGFVSSTNSGGLARNMDSQNPYFFPVGSSAGTTRFRPVTITPNSIAPCTFKVRMANVDATLEGYDRASKENTIGSTNPNFYHRISKLTSGTEPADITLYYDELTDGTYDLMANWDNTQWKNMGVVSTTSGYGLSGTSKQSVSDFYNDPFILSENVPDALVANVFSPNGDGVNDVLHVIGKSIEEMQFVIYDRWGEKVFVSDNTNNGWDGTYKGKPMNSGVFVYTVKGKFKNGDAVDKKGNITLLR